MQTTVRARPSTTSTYMSRLTLKAEMEPKIGKY